MAESNDIDRVRAMSDDDVRASIEHHLHANALRYRVADGGRVSLELFRFDRRAAARLYWYRVRSGSAVTDLVVKIPREPADAYTASPERPRLAPPPLLDVKYQREFEALSLVQQHFAGLNDNRFGFVPVLDRIDALGAVVTKAVYGQSMIGLAPQLTRFRTTLPPASALRTAIENSGAWLRKFHELTPEGTIVRQGSRAEVIEAVGRYCDHLGRVLSKEPFFRELRIRAAEAAHAILPSELPLVLCHGDFAMRNVILDESGRVTVFDTLAMWRAPQFEDLAKFGLAMRLGRAQLYSLGLAFDEKRLTAVDDWLFAGYFGRETAPVKQVHFYALLLLLDKWSFEVAVSSGRSRVLRVWHTSLINARCTRQVGVFMGALT